jgi:chromosome segregation protein
MQQLDAEQAAVAAQIAMLTAQIDEQAAAVEAMDAEHTAGVERGYEFDRQIREAGANANHCAVELERVTARMAANTDRVAELTARIAAGGNDLEQAREQLRVVAGDLEAQRSFLENATAEASGAREAAQAQQQRAQEAVRAVAAAEQQAEQNRRGAMQLVQRAAASRNEQAQAEAALASLESEQERLVQESDTARRELAELGIQRGQVAMTFGDVTERLKALEAEIAELRLKIDGAGERDCGQAAGRPVARRAGDAGRAAGFAGRADSRAQLLDRHGAEYLQGEFAERWGQWAVAGGDAGGFS